MPRDPGLSPVMRYLWLFVRYGAFGAIAMSALWIAAILLFGREAATQPWLMLSLILISVFAVAALDKVISSK